MPKETHAQNAERHRLDCQRLGKENWRLWGPYLSERAWGTVREDYSAHGNAWEYFDHDQARSRAYRWNEDGLAGISDEQQKLCVAFALWNGRDPILKERLFGLTNSEGNHGEDVKEIYYYLDATPTHSYLKMLYKYPQSEFPYAKLVAENRRRGMGAPEYELIDSGVFDDDHYFDVFVEYAKAGPEDVLIRVTTYNRALQEAPLHLLAQLWFRNTWSWKTASDKPEIVLANEYTIEAGHAELGSYHLYAEGRPTLLFCDNESNACRLWGVPGAQGYFKDAFHEYVIHGRHSAVNPDHKGTKAAAWYRLDVPAQAKVEIRLRLSKAALAGPFAKFGAILEKRRREADAFYAELQRGIAEEDERLVQRQAFAGMIWSKQFYYYDVPEWLNGDETQVPPPPSRKHGRNWEWAHLNNADIISMPDKWEYPWYAAWDLAFHCIALALVDAEFAKAQLVLLTREWYMHPNGQVPAYEWAFGDVNPPVHAWAAWRVFQPMSLLKRAATCARGKRNEDGISPGP